MGKFTKFIGILFLIFGIINIANGITGGTSFFGGGGIEITISNYLLGIVFIVIGFVLLRIK